MERSPRSEHELVRYVLAGDESAWRELVDRYHRLVWHIVRASPVAAADAEDAVQIVFLRLAERLHSIQDPGKLTSFVAGLARNTALETARREWRFLKLEERGYRTHRQTARLSSPEEIAIHNESVEVALFGLSCLPFDCQQLLRMFLEEELTTAEVAEALDLKPGTIRVQKSRCLELLRQVPEVRAMLERGAGT